MRTRRAIAAAGAVVLLGSAGLVATGFAQSPHHGEHGMPTQEMDGATMDGHGATVEETRGDASHGEAGAHADDHARAAPAGTAATGSPATEAYRAANLAMHEAMDIEFSDDADIDFARGMIGHHQGAIDMARIVLEHGTDPELRRLAEEVIEAQEGEIAFLRDWLAQRGK